MMSEYPRVCHSKSKGPKCPTSPTLPIKPTDGVIVGMYPRFFDEIKANAEYARQFGGKKS